MVEYNASFPPPRIEKKIDFFFLEIKTKKTKKKKTQHTRGLCTLDCFLAFFFF